MLAEVQQALTEQCKADVRKEEEKQQAKQKLAEEIAELHRPQVCHLSAFVSTLFCSGRNTSLQL